MIPGRNLYAWYHTNSYATLTLRSTISMEIIERLQKEDDISLAFPTQSIYVDKDVSRSQPHVDLDEVLPKGLY
jgi:small-conductance mechanosensitive channel